MKLLTVAFFSPALSLSLIADGDGSWRQLVVGGCQLVLDLQFL